MTVPQATEYELQRLARIERNRKLLHELGIDEPLQASRPGPKPRRPLRTGVENAVAEVSAPCRRSRRLQGSSTDLQELGWDDQRVTQARSPKRKAYRPPTLEDETALDDHNLHRMRTMSHTALQRRIWKIRKVEKLQSFIKVLEACDEAELAQEAQEALTLITG